MAKSGGIRIWHQSMTELDALTDYRKALERHAQAVTSPGTTVEVHGIPSGAYGGIAPTDLLLSPYPYHLILSRVIEYAYQAERKGYDAFVVGSYSEPFLKEMRGAVDIPVVSVGESTFLVACSVAKYQGLISNAPEVARIVKGLIDKHALAGRVSGVYWLDPPMNEPQLSVAFDDPAEFLANFNRVAERAIGDGADVIIPAEGVFNEILVTHGVQFVGKVPVMDAMGVVWNYAEMMVNLRRRTGLVVGRHWEYQKPGDDIIGHVRRWSGVEEG